jgi:protein SCO1
MSWIAVAVLLALWVPAVPAAAGVALPTLAQNGLVAPKPGALKRDVAPTEFNRAEKMPAQLEGVGIKEKVNQSLPLDVTLIDERGEPVQLAKFFGGGKKPVVLNLGYYGCPMLCGLVTNGLVEMVKQIGWTPGDEFEVITLSIDPAEKFPLAMAKKRAVMEAIAMPSAASGWHFLTGDEKSIQKVSDAVGFSFKWDPAQQQYAHSAVLILLTPDGRVSRYLYGIRYGPKTARLSLVEASNGRVGSSLDQVMLMCFHFNPDSGNYSFAAMNLMRFAGIVTVLFVAGGIGWLVRREMKNRGVSDQNPPAPPLPPQPA